MRDILGNFQNYYKELENSPHYSDYVSRDMLSDKTVYVMRAGEVLYSGKAIGIDKNFALTVEHDGKKENLATGEVSVKI